MKVYTKEDFEKMGWPNNELGERYIELNGQRYRLYQGWFGNTVTNDCFRPEWYGKIALVEDGKNINVLDLETGEVKFLDKKGEFNTYYYKPINKDFYVVSSENYFSERIQGVGGYTVDRVSEGQYNIYKDGIQRRVGYGIANLKNDELLTEEVLYKRLEYAKLKEKLNDTVTKMTELGISKDKITELVDEIYSGFNKSKHKESSME